MSPIEVAKKVAEAASIETRPSVAQALWMHATMLLESINPPLTHETIVLLAQSALKSGNPSVAKILAESNLQQGQGNQEELSFILAEANEVIQAITTIIGGEITWDS